MAATKKTTARRVKSEPVETTPAAEVEAVMAELPVVETKPKRTFADNDWVYCTSITPGEYLFEGPKSKTVYSWIDAGVTEPMRYDDLSSAVRTRKPCVFKPRIIIQDEEFLVDYPELQRLYDSLYSKDDLTKILELDAGQMISVIKQLPDGAKDALKTMAVNAIETGRLDSVARVRALDQYFGTDMLLKLAN